MKKYRNAPQSTSTITARFLFCLLTLCLVKVIHCSGYGQYYKGELAQALVDIKGDVVWARSSQTANANSIHRAVVADNKGNVYASGEISASGVFDFGNGITLTNPVATNSFLLIKYDSNGTPLWARTVISGSDLNDSRGLCWSPSGFIYSVGQMRTNGNYDFGSGTIAGSNNTGGTPQNPVIIKFNESGITLWARTITAGQSSTIYFGCAVDGNGNIYAVGQVGNNAAQFNFGNGVTLDPPTTPGLNALVVKYDANGNAQWARSLPGATAGGSAFYGVTSDTNGTIYTAGIISGQNSFDFGNSVVVTGAHTGQNSVIVKYDSNGNAQWARTPVSSTTPSEFSSITLGSTGNVFVAGNQTNTVEVVYQTGISLSGGSTNANAVAAKYNSSGDLIWAKTTTSGASGSEFLGIATDNSGNAYAVGNINNNNSYDFGNGVSVTGLFASSFNLVLVKYANDGTTLLGRTLQTAPDLSIYRGVSVDSLGNLFAAGNIRGVTYSFDDAVSVTGGYTGSFNNPVLVKYR